MALTPGTRLGVYEVTEQIGEGGMGQVYRATDTRLKRQVAIKVLPPSLAADHDRLARFQREAEVLASLNHPHIAGIYGLEESAGITALVMELVEGEDLSQRIARGAIPLEEALPIAKQIAEALEAAHEQGIIHRDLKPANIKVRADGTVKVLDYGLAKALDPGGSSSLNAMNSPTFSMHATMQGVILGTAAYMAPEQARAKAVDKRADIWAFGVVMFEMLTGRRAFGGENTSDVLAAVLRQDVEWAMLPAATPPRLRRLLERCLDRDVKQRLRDIGEARVTITAIQCDESDAVPSSPPTPRANRHLVLAAGAATIAVIATGAWWFGQRSRPPEARWSEFTQLTDASGVETGLSISPDGTSFAYVSAVRGSWDIYVQRVGGRNSILVAGDPNRDELWPAFSPDGKLIAFSQGGGSGGIFIVGATGESVRRLTDFGSNPAWSPDGQHIAFCSEEVKSPYEREVTSPLWIVDVNGGAPTKIDDGDAVQPAWSPSGRRIAFWQNIKGQRDLATIPATGGPHVLVTEDAAVDWAPVWSPDGRFLYFASDRGGSMGIWRIGIDEVSGQTTGGVEPVALGVDVSMDLPHLSADGRSLVFRSMNESINPAAITFDPATDRAGDVGLLQHRTGMLTPTDVSPDGKWIALNNVGERQLDIFVMRSDGSWLTRLTDDLARDWVPQFTPDGSALTFQSNKNGTYQGWSIRLDGSNRTQLTDTPDGDSGITAFAPDGRHLMTTLNRGSEILVGTAPWPVTRKGATRVVTAPSVGGGVFVATNWSPDGHWWSGGIAFASGGFRGNALYDIAADRVKQLSDDAKGGQVAWMPGNTRVLYFTAVGRLVSQDIRSLQRHEVSVKLPFPPNERGDLRASPDGRTLYYGAQQREANIWKVEWPNTNK